MSNNSLPYYKRYPRDFIEGTIGMGFEEKTTYSFILDLIYLQNGNLPDDPRYISGLLNCSVRKWNLIRKSLIEMNKIQVISGFIMNYRALIEVKNQRKYQDNQAQKRAETNKNNNLTKTTVKPFARQPEPYKKEIDKSISKKTQLPDDWEPGVKFIKIATDKNLNLKSAHTEADKFKAYHLEKASKFKRWDLAFGNWIAKALEYNPILDQEVEKRKRYGYPGT